MARQTDRSLVRQFRGWTGAWPERLAGLWPEKSVVEQTDRYVDDKSVFRHVCSLTGQWQDRSIAVQICTGAALWPVRMTDRQILAGQHSAWKD